MQKIVSIVIMLGIFFFSATYPFNASAETVYQLLKGQWVESAGPDPFGEGRPVQLWVSESTLLYNLEASKKVKTDANWKYREAITQNGIPIHFKAREDINSYNYKKIWESETPPENKRFFFTQSILCLGETNQIKINGENCDSGNSPVGEGWHFEIKEHSEAEMAPTHAQIFGILDSDTLEKLNVNKVFLRISIVKKDLDKLEKMGKLVRFDRKHPLVSFRFVGSSYLPCNSEEMVDISEEYVAQAYAKVGGEAGFNFFSWLKATIESGLSAQASVKKSTSTTVTVSAKEASVFKAWGIMIDSTNRRKVEAPFYLEKSFECQPGQGTKQPGKRITSVEFKYWDSESDTNIPYKFTDPNKFLKMDNPEIYSNIDRPVFISANSSKIQASIVEHIAKQFPEFSYNQALFVFSQLNNSCTGIKRDSCLSYANKLP